MDESVPTIFSPFVQQKKSATTRIILGHDIHTHHNHFRIQDQACWFKTSLIQCCWKVLYPFEITKYFHSFRPDSLPSIIFKADQRCSGESKIRFHSLMSDTLFLLLSVQVSTKLRELSYNRGQNAAFFTTLAEQVEDFSVTLLDQIYMKEKISIGHEEISDMDPCASFLDSITLSAIRFSQKNVHKLYNDMAAGFKRSTKVAINSAITQQSFYIFSEAQNIARC